MNSTRSPALRAKPISWVTTSIVMPSRASEVMTSSTSLTISGSRALVGSSNSMTLGCIARARAMATRCCWPPESWAGSLSFCASIPTRSSSETASSSALPLFILRTLIGPRVTFCRIVLCAKRLNDWNTMPTSDRSWASALPSAGSGTPSISIRPESIDSSRLMVRHSVDLPEPDGPSTMHTWPDGTSSWMFFSTCKAPKCFSTSCIETIGRSLVGVDVTGGQAHMPSRRA